MKKLKVILAVLFAMLLSCALFACTNSEEENDDTKMVIKSVISVDTIELTDSDGETEYTAKCATISSKWNTNLTGAQRTVTVSGADLTFSGNVTFGTVGSYTVTVTPKENNTGNVSATTTVTISHDFQPVSGQEGVEECAHDGARRTTTAQDVTLHYGTFHAGTAATVPTALGGGQVFTNNSENKTLITDFGTVEMNGKAVTVPTVTAGRLEPGVTITVRGQAKTTYSDWDVEENAYYYFPVVGIADPYLNGSNVGSYDPYPNYTGGTAVMVRGEGWVLYNGIGETSATRTLASLSGGTNDALNYGSHDSDTGGNQPDGYVLGQMPDPSSSDWKNWWVYSKGNTCNSGDQYTDMTDLEITWYYRTDGIIEITYNYDYNNTGNNRVLTSYIKVPEATRGYYQTILHGDYTDITISEIVTVETMTTEGFRYNGMDASGTVYYEGQSFDASAIRAEIKYVQLDNWQTYSVSAADVYATESEVTGESDDTDDVVWVNLADNPMSSAFKSYKIMLVKSQQTWTQYIPANTISVISNSVGSARGEDDTKIGALTIGTTTSGGNGAILLTLPASENHYVVAGESGAKVAVIRLLGNGYGQFSTENVTASADEDSVNLSVSGNGNEVVLTLSLTKAAMVTVSGLQTTDIVLDLTSLTGFTVDSSAEGTVTLNGGGNVTLTYNLASDADIDKVKVSVDGGTILGKSDFDSDWVKEGVALGGGITYVSHSYDETTKVFTLTVKVPAADIVNFTSTTKHIVTLTYDGVAETADTIYYGMEYDEELDGDRGVVLADGMYTFVENGKIYIAISADSDEVESEWLTFPYELTVNVNNGDIENVWLLDLGFETVNGAIAYLKPADLPEGVEISYVVVGTIDDASDIDHGVLVLVSIDVSELGIEGDYAYEVMPEENEQLVYYAVSNNAITVKQGAESLQKAVVTEGNCLETGLAAYEVNDGQGNVVFYLGVSKIAGMHADEDENGVCDLCGGTIATGTIDGTWWNSAVYMAIEDGETIEFEGTYASIGSDFAGGMSLVVTQSTNGAEEVIYSLNGNGYGEACHFDPDDSSSTIWDVRDTPYNADIADFEDGYAGFTNSLITVEHPYNTLNGSLDGNGNEIDASALRSAAVGGTIRYIVVFDGDTITVNMRLYEEGVSLNGTPYFNFTFTMAVKAGSTYSVRFCGSDGNGTLTDDTCTYIKSVKNNSVLIGGSSESGLTFTDPELDGGYVTLTADGLAAKDTEADAYYAEFTLNFSQNLAASTTATVKDANGNAVTGATAVYDAENAALDVYIPVSESSKGVFTIELSNLEGSTMQTDIKIDLSDIGFARYMFEVTENTLDLSGSGTVTLTLSGLTSLEGYKLSVNGSDAAQITGNAEIGGLVVDSATADTNGATIVLSVKSVDFTKALTAYKIELIDSSSVKVAATSVDNVKLPDSNIISGEDIYVAQNGTTLSFVFTSGLATPSTEDFKLNINQGAATQDDVKTNVLLHDLGFHISEDGAASFTENNWLTRNATVLYSYVNGKAVVAVNINLAAAYGFTASDSYAFETYLLGAKDALYYQVSSGVLTQLEAAQDAELVAFAGSTCDTLATSAKGITSNGAVVLYYDITPTGASHSWSATLDENGYYVCSECGALYRPGDATNRTIAASYLSGVAENGLTVSFWGRGDSGNDWNMQSLKTTVGNLVLMLPNLGGAAKTSLTDDDKTAINALRNGVSDSFDRIDENAWPAGHASVGADDWNTLDLANCYITIVVSPTDGISFYKNGVIAIKYAAATVGNSGSNDVTSDPWTVGDFAQAFLALAEYGGVQFGTAYLKKAESLLVQTEALDANAVATRYANYLAEADFLPQHVHTYDPDTDRCPDDGALNPDHVHKFVDGVCIAGDAQQITVSSGTDSYTGVIEQVTDFTNNDTSVDWWNGITSDISMSGDSVTVITWENTRDPNYYDYAFEGLFTDTDGTLGYVDVSADGAWLTWNCTNYESPTISASNDGTVETAGNSNAGYGTYKATVVRIGTVLTVVVEFTANGADAVTWTRTGTAVGVPTADFALRIAGNPYFLDNFVAYYGTVTQVTD